MAITEPLLECRLTADDVDSAQALAAEAGWNQSDSDWNIFLELGHVIGFRASHGKLIATAAVLPYPSGFGWISMMLVTHAWRRRGIATKLLKQCVDTLQKTDATPMLDATPAGSEVYRRFGFRDRWLMTRWRRTEGDSAERNVRGVRLLKDGDWTAIESLDADCFGSSRKALLARLYDRSRKFSCVAETDGHLRGFLLGRDGRTATQLGPLVAHDEQTAALLIEFAARRVDTAVVLDALDRHSELARCLAECGFVRERPFTRMVFGTNESFGDPSRMFAIAGPELG